MNNYFKLPDKWDSEEGFPEALRLFADHIDPSKVLSSRFLKAGMTEWFSEGCYSIDPQGKKYFDALGSGGVFGLGYRHPKVIQAVREQMDRYCLSGRFGVTPAQGYLAQELLKRAPGSFERVYFGNSGTEAIEAAIKLALLTTGRDKLIGTELGYHGMSVGALSLGNISFWRQGLGCLLSQAKIVPNGDAAAMVKAIDAETAAVVIEPIPWAAGCPVYPREYFSQIRERCDETGALLIVDEIQTGMGRVGSWFASEVLGIEPDILCVGKILSGGVIPISATLYGRQCILKEDSRMPFNVSSFGGNALACVAGLATIDTLEEENLIERCYDLGLRVEERFESWTQRFPEVVVGHRGLGLMRCIDVAEVPMGYYLMFESVQEGYVIGAMSHMPTSIRISPPFIATEAEIDGLLDTMEEKIVELSKMTAQNLGQYMSEMAKEYQKAVKAMEAIRVC